MPKVTVEKETSLQPKDAFDKVSRMLEEDRELQKLDPGFKCNFDSSNLTGTAKGNQFKADMKVTECGSATQVKIVVDLPFHLGLVKGLVQKTLQKKLDKSLA